MQKPRCRCLCVCLCDSATAPARVEYLPFYVSSPSSALLPPAILFLRHRHQLLHLSTPGCPGSPDSSQFGLKLSSTHPAVPKRRAVAIRPHIRRLRPLQFWIEVRPARLLVLPADCEPSTGRPSPAISKTPGSRFTEAPSSFPWPLPPLSYRHHTALHPRRPRSTCRLRHLSDANT